MATLAARQGAVVTGLDLAPKLIETARRLAAENGLEITYEVGDCEDVPHPDASFDVVSSAMVLLPRPTMRQWRASWPGCASQVAASASPPGQAVTGLL